MKNKLKKSAFMLEVIEELFVGVPPSKYDTKISGILHKVTETRIEIDTLIKQIGDKDV